MNYITYYNSKFKLEWKKQESEEFVLRTQARRQSPNDGKAPSTSAKTIETKATENLYNFIEDNERTDTNAHREKETQT